MAVGYNLVLFLAYYHIFLNYIQPKHFYTMRVLHAYCHPVYFLTNTNVKAWNIPTFLLSWRKINLRKQVHFPTFISILKQISLLTHLHSQYFPCLLVKLLHSSLSERSQRFLNFCSCKLALTLNILSLAPCGDFKCSFVIFHILPPPHGCLFPRTVSDFSRELSPHSNILPPDSCNETRFIRHATSFLTPPGTSQQHWAGREAPQKRGQRN